MSNISRVKLQSPIKNDKRTFNATDDAAYIALKDYFEAEGYTTIQTEHGRAVDLIATNKLNSKKAYAVELKIERSSDKSFQNVMLKKKKISNMKMSGFNNIIICFAYDLEEVLYTITLEDFIKYGKPKTITFRQTDCDDSPLEAQEVLVVDKKLCKRTKFQGLKEKYNKALFNCAFKYQIISFIKDLPND